MLLLRPAARPSPLGDHARRANEISRASTREVDLLAVRDDEVEHLDARLVDVILEALRLAVEHGEADERHEGDDEAERGAVHRLGDALGEDAGLLARVHALAGDGAEALDQA